MTEIATNGVAGIEHAASDPTSTDPTSTDPTSTEATPRVPRRRLAIGTDGSVAGGDTADHLGVALRYACRMASQMEPLLDIGQLQWLSTLRGTSFTARVGHVAGDVTVTADVGEVAESLPVGAKHVSVDADGAHAAIRKGLQMVHHGLEADWCAIITWDQRIVGAILPESGRRGVDVRTVLPEVGLRALALLGSLDESCHDTAVVLEYASGSMLVAAVEGDVLFAFADTFDTAIAGGVIDRVRAALAPHDLDLVWTWGDIWATP